MNNNRRYNRKRMGQKLDHQSTQSFLALQFTDSLDELYTSEYVESSPSVIISGTDFIFDYSSKTNKDKYQDVVTLLKLKKSGITFDISNAEYYNPENNISANFSGTYTLSRFLGDDKIILSNVSGATWDSKQKLYKDNYFKSNVLMGLTLPTGATGHYKVTNQLGYTSSESFSKMGAVAGDFLKIVAATGGIKENKLYEILEFDIDYQGKEILTIDREVPEIDLTGETVSVTLFKPEKNMSRQPMDGLMCFYAKETLFNPKTYEHIEKGSLVECRNGREQQGRIESVENGFDFIFASAPFAIDGYYPLYNTANEARSASPTPTESRPGETTKGYHEHKLGGVVYYMPNGLGGPGSGSQFHGDYKGDAIENLSEEKFNASECETCPPFYQQNPETEIQREQTNNSLRNLTDVVNTYDDLLYPQVTDITTEGAREAIRQRLQDVTNFRFKTPQEYKNVSEQLIKKQVESSLGTNVAIETPIQKEFNVRLQNSKATIDGNPVSVLNLVRGQTYKFLLSLPEDVNLEQGPFSVYGTDSNRGNPTGFYYPVFSTPPQGISIDESISDPTKYHTHNIDEIPNITFYMPNTSKNHGRSTRGGYPQFLARTRLENDPNSVIIPTQHRLSFSKTPDGSNAGGSLIYTGVQRVNLTNSNYVLLTVPKNLNEFYYFLEGLPGSGGKINVLGQGT